MLLTLGNSLTKTCIFLYIGLTILKIEYMTIHKFFYFSLLFALLSFYPFYVRTVTQQIPFQNYQTQNTVWIQQWFIQSEFPVHNEEIISPRDTKSYLFIVPPEIHPGVCLTSLKSTLRKAIKRSDQDRLSTCFKQEIRFYFQIPGLYS